MLKNHDMETVIIPEPKKPQTVGEIAAHDVRKAEVFKKFGIEFCCGGNKSLDKACADLKIMSLYFSFFVKR